MTLFGVIHFPYYCSGTPNNHSHITSSSRGRCLQTVTPLMIFQAAAPMCSCHPAAFSDRYLELSQLYVISAEIINCFMAGNMFAVDGYILYWRKQRQLLRAPSS